MEGGKARETLLSFSISTQKEEIPEMQHEARRTVINLLNAGDLESLLRLAGELHGHFCPGLAFGVKAAYLGLRNLDFENTGMEELVAIVECNNCFVDGIQMVTGCSFGNNALIYKDLGKTAVTLVSRNLQKAFRIVLRRWESQEPSDKEKEARELFERVVKRREKEIETVRRMQQLWTELSFAVLQKPDEDLFNVYEVPVDLPAYAPIFDNAICQKCGEACMETRAVLVGGKPHCITCAGSDFFIVTGKGIQPVAGSDRAV
jgi:formylmethanofuran dehydrogenase subunit E